MVVVFRRRSMNVGAGNDSRQLPQTSSASISTMDKAIKGADIDTRLARAATWLHFETKKTPASNHVLSTI